MPVFKYKGYAGGGGQLSGEIMAETIEEAERKVSAQDVTIISIIPAGMRRGGHGADGAPRRVPLFQKRVSEADAATVLHNLAVMSETGVPFIEALDAIIESARTPKISAAMEVVKNDVVGGKPLSAALKDVPIMFPPMICDLVRVAEEAGQLYTALESGAGYLERAADLRRRILQAMLYPAIMLSVALSTVAVLVVFVMPKFADIFMKMKADVPASTRAMLGVGDFVRSHPLGTIGLIVGFALAVRAIMKTPSTRRVAVSFFLKVPGLGPLLRDLALSRALQSVSTLLAGNVPVMEALEQGANVAGNEQVADAFRHARDVVEHGGSLAEGIGRTPIMPKLLVQMVSVGERTGRLPQLMVATANKMDEEAGARLKAMVALLEPVMIVVMGVVVGTITISVITPIYSVIQNLK
ncbi:MAG TPA: type II secretion system F family protein [Fimbriimonadaceae bacterium]|nr:type II secretion system F family protein [Fimbriimonadaceae bacterium]